MHHSLRFQLVASVVLTLVVGLGASEWFATRLSERALERDLRQRADLVVETVGFLWGQRQSSRWRRELSTLVRGQMAANAIDVFRREGDHWIVAATTRSRPRHGVPAAAPPAASSSGPRTGPAAPPMRLSPEVSAAVLANRSVAVPLSNGADSAGFRLVAPLPGDGRVEGAVQVEVQPEAFVRLKRGLRMIDFAVLAGAIALVSIILTLVLERGVTRPLTALVSGMQRVEQGDLGVRVPTARGEEFEFLARGFNRMIGRLGEFTGELERRVQQATAELAGKNHELQQVNQRLSEAQLEIARSERLAAQGQLATAIAHELGTPLNSVLGFTQLLRRDERAPERSAKLAMIESQVQRIADTIRSMLDRARNRAPERVPVAVEPLVHESLMLVAPRLDARGLTVRVDVPPGLPAVAGDPVAIRQVLMNLLTNAIDATPPEGTITVGARRMAENGSRSPCLELQVADTGHGMTAEQIRRACEPFFTTKLSGEGTGLGLVIVDHIVRAHRGRLLIESRMGEGTTVQVQLPLEV